MPESLPDISIITPCFQAARFLKQAITSVQNQAGVTIEHIVVDGGSTDETVSILQQFPDVRWVSEPDDGQASAFNKGLRMARAPLIGWLNADDWYLPDVLREVVAYFAHHPSAQLVNASMERVSPEGKVLELLPAKSSRRALRHFWLRWYGLNHPATFYRRELFESIGPVDEQLHYAMDYDFYLRAAQVCEFHDLPVLTTRMLVHPDAKTSQGWAPFGRDVRTTLRKVWWPRHPVFYTYSLLGVRWYEARSYLVETFVALRAADRAQAAIHLRQALRAWPLLPLLPAFYPWAARLILWAVLGEERYARLRS